MKTKQEHIEYFELTSETNVKYRFKINKARGIMDIEVGVVLPDRNKRVVVMSTSAPIGNDTHDDIDTTKINRLIGATIREWDDCEGYEIISEEDAGEPYTYWED